MQMFFFLLSSWERMKPGFSGSCLAYGAEGGAKKGWLLTPIFLQRSGLTRRRVKQEVMLPQGVVPSTHQFCARARTKTVRNLSFQGPPLSPSLSPKKRGLFSDGDQDLSPPSSTIIHYIYIYTYLFYIYSSS